jgi:hypothetical protein
MDVPAGTASEIDRRVHMKSIQTSTVSALTLYDGERYLFIPNEQKKYSVGENSGMKLDASGGIEIHVAAKQPPRVPAEDWLPINRKDQVLHLRVRVYAPESERMRTWQMPRAERVANPNLIGE